jgi:zinc transport system substrate-binding protein
MRRASVRVKLAAGSLLALWVLGAAPAAAAEPKVVVTIKPLHALVAQVMAGVGSPVLLVKGLASPHTYALRPSEARALNAADLFVRMSETVEPFTAKVVQSLPDTVQVLTLQEAPRVKLLSRRTHATFERHTHADGAEDNHGRAHDRGSGRARSHPASHSPGATDAVDGHAWLDPDNAVAMVERIEQVLSAKDPAHAPLYKANATALRSKLEALAAELGRDLAPIASRPYIVFHDATQYLERRYGLNVVGSISISPEVPASGKRLTELRRRIVELGAVCVFAEPQFDTRLVANLIEGTAARSGTLDPEGGRLEPGPDLYFTLMRQLAGDLKGCLAPPA